ncbi:MAG: oxygen-independent coproporphyrinogen III oxidase, partial [Campylobacter sp.]|nr:oxygen-independent coproporphyrinogen III oxidase [Campylobacter sp.]
EYLSDDEWSDERLLLGLRSKLGVDEKYIKNKEILEFLEKDKKILRENGRVFNKNFLLADELACVLC